MKQNKKQREMNIDKYTISGLWITMCGYIVLMFVKELLSQHYLISFSIDLLVAVVAFYITLYHLMNQYCMLKQGQMKPFIVQVAGLLVGLFVAILTFSSPFDVSFLILVIAFITNKKMVEKIIHH